MAVSFNDLYNANRQRTLGTGGMYDRYILGMKNEEIYNNTLADYTKLTSPTGAGAGSGTGTTLRSVTPLPKPTMGGGGSTSYKGEKVVPYRSVGGSSGGSGNLNLVSTVTGDDFAPKPSYKLPEYDTAKVESLGQRFAAPGVRHLRSALQDVQQGSYENPNVKRMTLRDSLAGYGQGLESVMAGALKEGANIYGQQYGAEVNKAGAEFSAGEARTLQDRSIRSQETMQGKSIASQETMQGRSLASQASLQDRSLAAQQSMHESAIASNQALAQYNNEWQAYIRSLT